MSWVRLPLAASRHLVFFFFFSLPLCFRPIPCVRVAHIRADRFTFYPTIFHFSASIPRYSDLNWRLDVEVASRTRAKAVTPSFVLQLNTLSGSMGNSKQQMLMTADYANMQHMRTELAAAVASMKSTRAMRVTRYLQ